MGMSRSMQTRYMTTVELTQRIHNMTHGALYHVTGLESMYELLYRSGDLLFVDYHYRFGSPKLTITEQGVTGASHDTALARMFYEVFQSFIQQHSLEHATYEDVEQVYRNTLYDEATTMYSDHDAVRQAEYQNLLLGNSLSIHETPHIHFFNVISAWNLSTDIQANPQQLMTYVKQLTADRTVPLRPKYPVLAGMFLYHMGIVHDYYQAIHQHFLQELEQHETSQLTVRSGFIYLIMMSCIVDAARAVEREHQDQPLDWIWSLVPSYFPQLETVLTSLHNIRHVLIAPPLKEIVVPGLVRPESD